MDFVETPEPFLPRQNAPIVSFMPVDATADISVIGPSGKAASLPQHWQQIKDVLRWRNPAVSALLFLIGTFCALAGEFVLRGDHSVTPLKGVPPTQHALHLSMLGIIVAYTCVSITGFKPEPCCAHPHTITSRSSCNGRAQPTLQMTLPLCPLCAVVSMLCLGDLALNFMRSMVSSSWLERAAWAASDLIRSTAEGAKEVPTIPHHVQPALQYRHAGVLLAGILATTSCLYVQAVHKLALWHDDFLSARNPVLTLRVAAALSAASILGSYFRHMLMRQVVHLSCKQWRYVYQGGRGLEPEARPLHAACGDCCALPSLEPLHVARCWRRTARTSPLLPRRHLAL